MVAFNFQERHAADVESGRKPFTIRQKKRCNVGDRVTLYTGQRTKHCRKLGEGICIGTAKVFIADNDPYSFVEEDGILKPDAKRRFFEQEGFSNAAEFVDFFRQLYGLPFIGWLHVWELTKDDVL